MPIRRQHLSVSLIGLALLMLACASPAPAEREGVLVAGAPLEAPEQYGAYKAGWILRVDLGPLVEAEAEAGEASRIRHFLRHPDGRDLDARLEDVAASGESVWRGRLFEAGNEEPVGRFTLTRHGDFLAGRLRLDEQTLLVEGELTGPKRLLELDPDALPPPGPPQIIPPDDE